MVCLWIPATFALFLMLKHLSINSLKRSKHFNVPMNKKDKNKSLKNKGGINNGTDHSNNK